ncbi:LytR C-terminal domain-containing protein [Belnapia rosea]|uniref:LytR C-terminal domain-containing protein n=1 Tax=Belnapia rosea TaxID=938405 RepID=UPI000882C85A|nr:LytR C-terminal domain-containing protein [Belnapia rosea]SDB08861.1 LytR cell envelope-related transcriptional attenuator [Belnapia rosea]
MSRRSPAPPLLRPQKRSWLGPTGLLLGLAGLAGGVVLGLGLRSEPSPAPVPGPSAMVAPAPPPVTAPPAPETPPPMPSRAAAPPLPSGPSPAELAAQRAALQAEVAAEQARLDGLRQARVALETELAGLRRDLTASRREAAQAAAAPPPVLGAPPRPLRLPESVAAPVLPAGGARVFIHLRAGSAAAASAAAELAPQLREAGFDIAEVRSVGATPSQRVVRYFHGEDAAAAARLAGRLGRGWAIQDFRNFEPTPSPQTLEIWLPDR